MPSIKDIKILLFVAYAVAYPLAVVPPIYIDPLITSHIFYGPRRYEDAYMCGPIYLGLLSAELVLLINSKGLNSLYYSICLFLIAIIISLRIFLPELPHGNLFNVGMTTSFLCALTIFVWSIGGKISVDSETLKTGGNATFEYMKALFAFVRQGAFAGVALFGALFFAAFSQDMKYSTNMLDDKRDIFLMNLNSGMQIAFYASYSVAGAVRYFFLMNLNLLSQFKELAARLDRETAPKISQ
jgi:hypothetical protein